MVCLDFHVSGQPVRLVTEGWAEPRGQTLIEKRQSARSRQDHLRRLLMDEPRGHADMSGVVLTTPARPDCDAGLLFMHHAGFPHLSAQGVIAAARYLADRQIENRETFTLDAPAGKIRCRVTWVPSADPRRVASVTFTNVPSFVLAAGVPVTVNGRVVNVDIAFGGVFHAIVDAESAGLAVVPGKLHELRTMGSAIARAVDREIAVVHPLMPELSGLDGIVFTGPPSAESAGLRSVAVFGDHAIDRSPCGTATCALLAVLDAMGLVDDERPFVHEGLLSTTLGASIVSRTAVGDIPAVVVDVSGSASLTGEHTFVLETDDPFPKGYRLT